MAQQDKTDWYWNGVLAGAVNNLYYDLINVDVVHTPYTTDHRNTSFFLKTRLPYIPERNWEAKIDRLKEDWDVEDVHIIWDEKCTEESGKVFLYGRRTGTNERKIFVGNIKDGCVDDDFPKFRFSATMRGCGDWKFFVTDYVKGVPTDKNDVLEYSSSNHAQGDYTGIQVNKIEGGTTIGLFQDEDTVNGYARWGISKVPVGTYLLVYDSDNSEGSGFAGQVRMVTGISSDGRSLELNTPWLGFKTPEGDEPLEGKRVAYKFFPSWGEVVGFSNGRNIELVTDWDENGDNPHSTVIYTQSGTDAASSTYIIGIASANDKVFILTDNGYIHYSKEGIGYNKFFIDEDMFAGVDKISITAYRDMIVAFGRRHMSLGVPDEQNRYWTMYNQSTSIGLWSRYSFAEYDGDLLFVSNDKRLLALTIQSTGRYGLSFEDVGDRLNGKLATLTEGDEVFVGSDRNNLRVFVNTKNVPYEKDGTDIVANDGNNTLTHIYKFDTLFKVWTEDHIPHFCIRGAKFGIYYGEYGLYTRGWNTDLDGRGYRDKPGKYDAPSSLKQPVETKINAYLIENESNWEGINSALANRPKLYQLAKLNRLITTLGPGVYTDNSKIKVTVYSKGIGYIYEFPISGDGNDWVGLITNYYLNKSLDIEDEAKIECMLSAIQDSQKQYQPNCPDGEVYRQYNRGSRPWCDKYEELITESHGICINDKIYELAPTMPLVTNLGENQDYATQIKIELIGGEGDIICFGGWLAEMFVAPLFTTGPDGEYQLQPNTDCE